MIQLLIIDNITASRGLDEWRRSKERRLGYRREDDYIKRYSDRDNSHEGNVKGPPSSTEITRLLGI